MVKIHTIWDLTPCRLVVTDVSKHRNAFAFMMKWRLHFISQRL